MCSAVAPAVAARGVRVCAAKYCVPLAPYEAGLKVSQGYLVFNMGNVLTIE